MRSYKDMGWNFASGFFGEVGLPFGINTGFEIVKSVKDGLDIREKYHYGREQKTVITAK